MPRTLAALLAAALAGPAAAQPQIPPTLTTAKVEKDNVLVTQTVLVPVARTFAVEVEKDGKKMIETRTVTEYVPEQRVEQIPLKNVKATDPAGKAIAADKLANLLKENTPVVVSRAGEVPEAFRKMFKDGVVILQIEAPKPPVKG